MEFTQYIRLIRRWLWLIVVMAFIGGSLTFIVNSGQPALYEAQTILAIGRFIEARNPEQADIRVGFDLAQTYAQLVRTHDVLQSTNDRLDLGLEVEEIEDLIETRILEGTSLLVISVTYTDAVLTADIANTLAFTRDTNLRMLIQDLGRVFYTDRPSMLTPEPMPH